MGFCMHHFRSEPEPKVWLRLPAPTRQKNALAPAPQPCKKLNWFGFPTCNENLLDVLAFVHFVTKVRSHFWNLHKITNFLTPNKTFFWEKKRWTLIKQVLGSKIAFAIKMAQNIKKHPLLFRLIFLFSNFLCPYIVQIVKLAKFDSPY